MYTLLVFISKARFISLDEPASEIMYMYDMANS